MTRRYIDSVREQQERALVEAMEIIKTMIYTLGQLKLFPMVFIA